MWQKGVVFMSDFINNLLALKVDPVYPGTPLTIGSSTTQVARMQSYLNALRTAKYATLPKLTVDGRYGSGTAGAVRAYQRIVGLSADGVIGNATWNAIVYDRSSLPGGASGDTWVGMTMQNGMRGQDVTLMQGYLNGLAKTYTSINTQGSDGKFGTNMQDATRRFQHLFAMSADGRLGELSWNKIVDVKNSIKARSIPGVLYPYPGTTLRRGSSGDAVRFIQSMLNLTDNAGLTVDGNFGARTESAVTAFQRRSGLKADGVVGSSTWGALMTAYNKAL